MAVEGQLSDDKTLMPGTIVWYAAPADTEAPTLEAFKQNRQTALNKWKHLGHTKPDGSLKLSSEGGETTVKGSMQKDALRTHVSPVTRVVEIELYQFDKPTLRRYFGTNLKEHNGIQYAQANPVPERIALFGTILDGDNVVFIHAHRVDVIGNGDLDMSSKEDIAALPMKFTILEGAHGTLGVSEVMSLAG